jgi:hypothetical protein
VAHLFLYNCWCGSLCQHLASRPMPCGMEATTGIPSFTRLNLSGCTIQRLTNPDKFLFKVQVAHP